MSIVKIHKPEPCPQRGEYDRRKRNAGEVEKPGKRGEATGIAGRFFKHKVNSRQKNINYDTILKKIWEKKTDRSETVKNDGTK